MACRWRFRHKLILAHGLVVAIVLLLLCGTLFGLISYRSTMRNVDKKLVEQSRAEDIRSAIKALGSTTGTIDLAQESNELNKRLATAREAVDSFQKQLDEYAALDPAMANGSSPDESHGYGWQESIHALGLRDYLDKKLPQAIQSPVPGEVGKLVEDPKVKDLLDQCNKSADDLVVMIRKNLRTRMDSANDDYKICLWFVLSITGIGVILMTGSLRFFYQWIFYPIRDLQLGVAKVAKGDFKHNINIKSSDEIQDLAAAFNDMTHRLDEMYSDLARQVNERSRQLVRSERLASVGFLAAGVAHEINNPLASIAFCSEALERRILDILTMVPAGSIASEESKVITKYLKMIQQESFRCKEITSRLLEFSRGGERRREPTDLCELVQNVLDMVQHLQNRHGKELLFNPVQEVVAMVNALEIKSVIVNLVVNALDSMDEGGALTITVGMRDGMAEMVFQDTGCGMTSDVLENIFEPFFTRNRTGRGTGLGLSICHRIINHHEGEIEAHSAGPNQGSIFVVRLPLQPAGEGQGSESKDLRVAHIAQHDAHFAHMEQPVPQHGRRAA